MRIFAMRIFVSSSLFLLSAAYNKDGHEAIGMTAMSAIPNGKIYHQIKRIFKGGDVAEVGYFAHSVDEQYSYTKPLHYQNYKLGEGGNLKEKCQNLELLVDDANCPQNRCLVQSSKAYYAALMGFSGADSVPVPTLEGTNVELTKADMMKFVVNLVGDLHQPLHYQAAGEMNKPALEHSDMSGKNIKINVRGKDSTMYDLWDQDIVDFVAHDEPGFWNGGWTNVQRGIRTRDGRIYSPYETYQKEVEELKQARGKAKPALAMFDRWAKENAVYACQSVYIDPQDGKTQIANGFKIPETDYAIWKDEMLKKILMAGARVAIILKGVASRKEIAAWTTDSAWDIPEPTVDDFGTDPLAENSGATYVPDGLGNKKTSNSRIPDDWYVNLQINLLIAVIFGAAFLSVMHFTAPPPRYTIVAQTEMDQYNNLSTVGKGAKPNATAFPVQKMQ